MFNVSLLSGIKYVDGGRHYPELDCLGIAIYIRELLGKRVTGLESGDLNDDPDDLAFLSGIRKSAPEDGSVAVCYAKGSMTHVGVCLTLESIMQVVEITSKRGIMITPMRNFERRFQKVDYYS